MKYEIHSEPTPDAAATLPDSGGELEIKKPVGCFPKPRNPIGRCFFGGAG